MSYNILVVNDHPRLLGDLSLLVKGHFGNCVSIRPERDDDAGFSVIKAVENLSVHPQSAPSIVLMDMDIYGDAKGGIIIAEKLAPLFPFLRVLFVSGFPYDQELLSKAINIPTVRGYFSHSNVKQDEELLKAIEYILRTNEYYFSSDALETMVSHYRSLLRMQKATHQ